MSSLLVACGSDSGQQVSAASLAEATRAAGSARFDVFENDGARHEMSGVFDFEQLNGEWRLLGDPQYPVRGRWSSGRPYIYVPSLYEDAAIDPSDPCADRPWLPFDPPDEIPQSVTSPTPFDPVEILAVLAELDVELTETGSDTISGTPVRRFDVRGDLQKLAPSWLVGGGARIEQVELWIDGDDRLRRVDWILPDVGSDRVEYSDFGVAVEPKPISADETCPGSSAWVFHGGE